MSTKLITVEQAIFAHEKIIKATGGSQGIRDFALLESALFRPAASFGGQDLYPTIFEKAAALVHSLLLNHQFVDGNKRTATFLVYRFLMINGYKFSVSNKELVQFTLDIEAKKLDLAGISSWLRNNSKKIR